MPRFNSTLMRKVVTIPASPPADLIDGFPNWIAPFAGKSGQIVALFQDSDREIKASCLCADGSLFEVYLSALVSMPGLFTIVDLETTQN